MWNLRRSVFFGAHFMSMAESEQNVSLVGFGLGFEQHLL